MIGLEVSDTLLSPGRSRVSPPAAGLRVVLTLPVILGAMGGKGPSTGAGDGQGPMERLLVGSSGCRRPDPGTENLMTRRQCSVEPSSADRKTYKSR